MEQFKKNLLADGISPSHHRIKVLEYLATHLTHPTVDTMHHDLIKDIPTISKATIYNTLNLFVEKGLAIALTITGGEIRYDYRTSPPHAHFRCIKCDRVFDVDVKCPCFGLTKIGAHRIQEVQLFFKGICKDCSRKMRGKNES